MGIPKMPAIQTPLQKQKKKPGEHIPYLVCHLCVCSCKSPLETKKVGYQDVMAANRGPGYFDKGCSLSL
jgi:hypothetical protein